MSGTNTLPIWLWPLINNVGGVDGRDGEKGQKGWPGERGDRGMTGPQGMEEGEKGDTGDVGMPGNSVSVYCRAAYLSCLCVSYVCGLLQGYSGDKGSKGMKGEAGMKGTQGRDMTSTGTTFIVWGQANCSQTAGTELLRQGRAASPRSSDSGSGTNYLCLPESPTFGVSNPTALMQTSIVGVKYVTAN